MRVSMCSLPISRSASNTSPLIIQSAGDPFELSVLSEARVCIVDMTTASKVVLAILEFPSIDQPQQAIPNRS